MVFKDFTVISDAVATTIPVLPMIAAGQGDGTANPITIPAYVAGSLEIYLEGWGRWTPNNSIVTAAGNQNDFTETDPTNGIITPTQILPINQEYSVYGTLAGT